jgi:hypothetical protein
MHIRFAAGLTRRGSHNAICNGNKLKSKTGGHSLLSSWQLLLTPLGTLQCMMKLVLREGRHQMDCAVLPFRSAACTVHDLKRLGYLRILI